MPDPGSPDLGAGADLIASPAALPGVVVAVSTDGTVWRRGQDGDWKQALLLLPASLVQGVPRITSVTAFTEPLSDAIYLGTNGYAVLISTDGGDDWIRAGPGLPNSVSSLSADSARKAVYAGTSDGLWEHVLQVLPAPPAYQDAPLVWQWLGIGAITLVASAAALLGMAGWFPAGAPAEARARARAASGSVAACPIALPPSPARTCFSTRTTRWTGIRGETRRSNARAARTARCCSRSATARATGAT